jgi:hypothetical protein
VTAPVDAAPAPRRRRGGRIALIVLAVVVVLLAIAAVIAETQGRAWAEDRIREEVAPRLGVSDPSTVGVDIPGVLLLQAIAGRIDRVTVTAPDATAGGVPGDLELVGEGLPISGEGAARHVTATFTVDADDAGSLAGAVSGVTLEDLAFEQDAIRVGATLEAFGIGVPVGMTLVPGVDGGALSFEPVSIEAAGAAVTVDELRSGPLGGLADALLTRQRICIADALPAGLGPESVEVTPAALTARFVGDDVALTGEKGTCA